MFPFMIMPIIPTMNEKPPTLYSILNSICNFDEEDYTKISDLAKKGRLKIFDFDYPLSEKVSKRKFEEMILNKFMMRRIGFDTVTAFKLNLFVKLNEIMPKYNMLFNAIDNWNIFEDGETITHESKTISNDKVVSNTKIENETTSQSEDITDMRHSELPQNEIENVQDGSYLTDYNLNKSTMDSNNLSNSNSDSESNTNSNMNFEEVTKRSPSDKINSYKTFEQIQNIYTMIFQELECLFYQLI